MNIGRKERDIGKNIKEHNNRTKSKVNKPQNKLIARANHPE